MSRVCLMCLLCCALLLPRAARADEFDTVALGDPVYAYLGTVRQAGWLGETEKKQSSAGRQALTRYEIALETARAILALNSRFDGDETTVPSSVRYAVRALHELTVAMRVELKTLDVDTAATLKLCDELSNPQLNRAPETTPHPATTTKVAGGGAADRHAPVRIEKMSSNRAAASTFPALVSGGSGTHMELPVSQWVRLYSVISSLERQSQDPIFMDRFGGGERSLQSGIVGAGASVDIAPWLRLHAGSEHHAQRFGLWNSPLNDAARLNTANTYEQVTGVDVKTPVNGVVLRSNWAAIHTDDDRLAATRLEAAIGYTGWQNRLALYANLSRLVPEEDTAPFRALTSTTAGNLNIAMDVTNRISLNLLYQQLFGSQDQFHADRALSGRFSIKW